MSIIEKAVGKLGAQPKNVEARKGEPASGLSESPDTIQKAAGSGSNQERDHNVGRLDSGSSHTPASYRRIKDPAEKKRIVDVPFDELHELGFLSPNVPRSAIAEEFRTIKRPLLKNISGESASPIASPNLIMVTSALQGDGKTFSAINLALSIAMEQDKTVLFVDADVSKANAGTLLNVPSNSLGLTDVLEQKGVELGDVILGTTMEKLSILPAGTVHERSNELLASDSMKCLMSELSQRYLDRVIVFDSPPLLLTTEAGVLASLMGQIVFVARANVTPQNAIIDALQYISEDKMVGMVLNGSRKHLFGSYGYGYGYGYGQTYGDRHLDARS